MHPKEKQQSSALHPEAARIDDWVERVATFDRETGEPDTVSFIEKANRAKLCKLMAHAYQRAREDGLSDKNGMCRLPLALIEATFGRPVTREELRVHIFELQQHQKYSAMESDAQGRGQWVIHSIISSWEILDGVLAFRLSPYVTESLDKIFLDFKEVTIDKKAVFAQLAAQCGGLAADGSDSRDAAHGSGANRAAG